MYGACSSCCSSGSSSPSPWPPQASPPPSLLILVFNLSPLIELTRIHILVGVHGNLLDDSYLDSGKFCYLP
jgi:hypothetical protein